MSERTVEEIARQIANTYGVGWATSRLYADVFAALRTEREARPDFPANWNDLSPAVQRAMAQFWQKLSVREREARVKAEAELEADRKAAKLIREAADLIGTSDTLTALREAIARVERAEAARDEWKAAFEAENLKAHRAGVTQQGALNRLNAAEAEAARLREALTASADTKAAYMGEFSFDIQDYDADAGRECRRKVLVPWDTVKQIMAAICARAALAQETENGN